jgi:hypothetical protein
VIGAIAIKDGATSAGGKIGKNTAREWPLAFKNPELWLRVFSACGRHGSDGAVPGGGARLDLNAMSDSRARAVSEGWHESLRPEDLPEPPSDRAFGLVFSALFTLLGAWSIWTGKAFAVWWIAAGLALFAAALIAPGSLAPANRAWRFLGLLLRKLITPIAMAIIFFGAIVPLGLLLRIFGRDPLQRRIDKNRTSYWIGRPESHENGAGMKNQF